MAHELEKLTTDFGALLVTLEGVLSTSQIWELEIHVDHDEHELAFEMLCETLRQSRAVIPGHARECFLAIARHLGIDEGGLRDLSGFNRN